MYDYSWLIPAIPLLASAIPIIGGNPFRKAGAYLAIAATSVSSVLSLTMLFFPPKHPVDVSTVWILPGTGKPITVGVYVDHLSLLMASITASIATLILIYSIGYMEREEGLPRYWTEMLLFTGSMLGFSLSDSIISMYIFWELVGVCSYLLIGFWYTKPEAAAAAKKAFVVTRVGDVAFLVGLIEIYLQAHTLSLQNLLSTTFLTSNFTASSLALITILIFFGAVGKSAQIPLFTWLPDAMEGPTTVSALIHSATMVAAGVYLVARLYPMFLLAAPVSLEIVAIVGAVSAFLAATMALTTYDLKRILAYSTMSQLGYMMTALGVGALGAGMFHLLNHAIFKAMLFLSAGAVLHVLDTRDIREMGGLWRKMKVTSLAFLVGGLALSGVFPFNGFFSKDLILGAAYEYGLRTGDFLIYGLTLFTVILTAVYIFRAFTIAFILPSKVEREVHEVPRCMTVPMIVLMALTVITGFLWTPFDDIFGKFIRYSSAIPPVPIAPIELTLVSLGFALTGIGVAYMTYIKNRIPPNILTKTRLGSMFYTLVAKSYYFDAAYDLVARGVVNGVSYAVDLFDQGVVDGIVNGIGRGVVSLGDELRHAETGKIRNYAAVVVIGLVVLIIIMELI